MSGAGRWPVASSDEDFTEFLSGAPPAAARMFWRFIGLARDCGAVTFELQRSRVVLRGSKRIFASVRVSARSGRARQPGPEDPARRPDPHGRAVDQDAVLSCLRRLGHRRPGCRVRPSPVRSTRRGRRQVYGGLIQARRSLHSRSSKSPLPKAATARSPVSGSLPEAVGASLAARVLSDGAIRPDDL